MSSYTIELRRIIDIFGREEVETWFKQWQLTDFLTNEQTETINNSGLFNKDTMIKNVVEAHLMHEIAYETVGEFKRRVPIVMRQIMNIEAPVLWTTCLQYNPLTNEHYTEIIARDRDGDSNLKQKQNNSGIMINSDTPQGQIDKSEILKGKYASNTSATDEETAGSADSYIKEKENIKRTVEGNRGILVTYQKLIEQYRAIIRSVENDVIIRTEVLFMGIY